MKVFRRILSALLAVGLLGSLLGAQQPAVPASANVPRLINFSGKIIKRQGVAAPGHAGVTFAIYGEPAGGAPLWMETQTVTADEKGNYTAQLGATKSAGLPLDLFSTSEPRWLGVRINGGEEQPRVLLVSVPYALRAGDAETIGGLPPSAFVLAAPAGSAAPPLVNSTDISATATPPAASNVTTAGGIVNTIPLWTTATNVQSSALTQTGTGATAKIGINTTAPTTTLDIHGSAAVRGTLAIPATGVATAAAGKPSEPINVTASTFNSSTGTAVAQTFQLKAEPVNSDTANAAATLNLLFGSGTNIPAETGFRIGKAGIIAFAPGQTFPGVITGVTAGPGLTGGGTVGDIAMNIDTTKIPQLATANTFTGNQTVNGNLTATGPVTGSGFQIGSTLFAFGSLSAANAFLGFAGNTTTIGGDNVGVGIQALVLNKQGASNTAVGSGALSSNTDGNDNTAIGQGALYLNTTGGLNTAVGEEALTNNTTGDLNTAVGDGALGDSTGGNDNTAVGYLALESNQNGNNNTATGFEALQENFASRNTADGYQALEFNSSGTDNVADGEHALLNNDTGANNTAVGAGALESNTSGTKLTCIGYLCKSTAQASINATAIGANAQVSVSNAVVLGSVAGVNGATATARVGIGTTTPTAILTIGRGAGHPVSDSWETYSSRRWKTNIQTLPNALSTVEQLRGVSYDLKDSGKHEIGVIAEEVGAVVPELVTFEANGKDARGVDYSRLTALLIEAAKQQQKEIQQQNSMLRAQSAAIRELKAQLRETRQTLQKVKAQVDAGPSRLTLATK